MKLWKACAAASMCVIAVTGCGTSGRQLKFGEQATVTAVRGGTIGVTVVGIEAGGNSDLSELSNPSKYAGETPYYLHYRLTKTDLVESTTDFVVTDGKNELTHLTVMGSLDATADPDHPLSYHQFSKCVQADSAEFRKLAKGGSVEGCSIYLPEHGAGAPTAVEWGARDGKEPEATWNR
ncbi:hypothetical protein [Amycolatopsis rhizosphaerae]|uniref:hypothetical protein n=1 Tax=Amycolatopsis rhizosphaerae TaxID=2053003 RepID=UPI0011A7CF7C|nr:hypothetical protein [Amycolatopsis rhizosphaerae]